MNEMLDALSANIQNLGSFAQMQDFRQHTGEGYVDGLMVIYADQVRALGELRKMFQTPSTYNGMQSEEYSRLLLHSACHDQLTRS